MPKARTISIADGDSCKINAEVFGITVQGPAVIIVLENTKELDAGERTSPKVDQKL